MPNILPVSDLRNYNEVLKNCQSGEPVFLTKNGRGRFVLLDIEDYERDRAEITGSWRSCEGRRGLVKFGRLKSSHGGIAYDETAN